MNETDTDLGWTLDTAQEAAFFSLALDLLCVLDRHGVVLAVNPAAEQILGFAADEIQGRSVFDFVHVDDQPQARAELARLSERKDSIAFECRVRRKDDTYCWLSCNCAAPSPDQPLLYAIGRDITRRKVLETEVSRVKRRQETSDRVNKSILYEWHRESDEVIWSGACQEILGYSIEEMATGLDKWLELIHPDDRYDAELVVDHMLASGQPARLEYRVRTKTGTYVTLRNDAQFVDDDSMPSVRMIGCLTDVTDLRRTERRLEQIAWAAPTGILLVDSDGRITFSNPAVTKQFGYSAEELRGRPVEILLPERFRSAHVGQRSAFMRDPQARPIGSGHLLLGQRKDGNEFPVDIALSPIVDTDGIAVACIIVDLSERLQAQQALRESNARLRSILDNTSAVVYVKDTDGKYLLVNRQFEQLFHVSHEKVLGLNDYDLFPNSMAGAFRANDEWVARTGEVLKTDEVAPHDDGPHNYVSVKFPLRKASGEIYAVAGISTDITDRVRSEREAIALKDRLELILNSIGDGVIGLDNLGQVTFVNRAAHQLLGSASAEEAGRLLDFCGSANLYAGAVLDGGAQRHLGEIRRADGTTFPAETIVNGSGNCDAPQGKVITFRDLTDLRRRQAIERKVESAHAVQQVLYPRKPPSLSGFDIAGQVFPADRMSGDYLDFIQLGSGRLAIAVGDVSGHGLGPALAMVETRAYLRATLRIEQRCDLALSKLNEELLEDTVDESFVTLFFGLLDETTRTFSYAGAGHDAHLLSGDGTVEKLGSSGIVLGVVERPEYEETRPLQLQSGDLLLLTTDGVYETMSPQREIFGRRLLVETVAAHRHRPAAEIVQQLFQATREFARHEPQADDVTILVAKVL